MPDVAVSAQCVVERVVVVPDMMDIVICVDHSNLNFLVFYFLFSFSNLQCVVLGFVGF